jgi:SAM-dependent methyltransferase
VTRGYEGIAREWLAWARTPGQDAYERYRDAFFALLPPPPARTLEIGSGEGRVVRDLAARGYDVVGLEPSPTLRAAAADADPDGAYVDGLAEELPFADASFDLVVAYNSLMDVDDMRATVHEAARVLVAGGRFCACVTHPISDAGRRDGDAYVLSESCLEDRWYDLDLERNGLRIAFRYRTYPLGAYFAALEDAGFLVEAVREPRSAHAEHRTRIPLFLMWRAVER